MTLNHVKLAHAVTFMNYFSSVVSLIFFPKTLIWNKITFRLSNSLNLAELVANELTNIIPPPKKFSTNIPFSILFITTYWEDVMRNPHWCKLLLIMNYQSSSFGGETS